MSTSSASSNDDLVFRGYKGNLPIFFESEVRVDKLLGTGSFCMAWTIRRVDLRPVHQLPNQVRRQRLAARVNAAVQKQDPNWAIYGKPAAAADPTAPPRCVVKRLRNDFYALFDDMSRAEEDLKAELEMLLTVGVGEHPNIIELYGIGIAALESNDEQDAKKEEDESDGAGGISFQPTFLILSRIRSTVEHLLIRWRDQRGLGVYEALSLDKEGTRNLWLERMLLLERLADAVRYLHSKRIIFRDVKPENIGMDDNGVVKLFDFGCAKRIDEKEHEQHDMYELTGNTGTPRYMPPEVALCKPYNYTVDVYSLAIVMHQILSLKTPFASVPPGEFHRQVLEEGLRPVNDSSWPILLREMMERMWDADPTERPSAHHVATTMSEMLRGADEELFPTSMFSLAIGRWFQT